MPKEPKPQALVHNEKTKIGATLLNSLAVSAFTVGAAAPFAGYLIGSIQENPLPSAIIWLWPDVAYIWQH